MRHLLSLTLLGLLICTSSPAQAATVTEATVTPETDYSNGNGYFRFTLPIPQAVEDQRLMLHPRVDAGDLSLVHAIPQGLPPKKRSAPDDKARTLTVTGRYHAGGPARLTLLWRPADGNLAPLMRINLMLADKATTNPEVRTDWARQQQQDLRSYSDTFNLYWNQVIAPQYQLAPEEPYGFNRRWRDFRRSSPDLYSIFSSSAAIQETLQLDMLGGRRLLAAANEPADVPLTDIKPPQVKSHPFAQMLQGRKPQVSPLARWIPADQYAVLFRDIRKEIEFTDLLADWGGMLLNRVEPVGQDFHAQQRLTRQLCLENSNLTRLFGSQLVAGMAFTGSDPFFREGTDFAVLFQLKKPQRFRANIEQRYADAIEAGLAQRQKLTIGGKPVLAVVAPDRSIASYALFLGDVAVVANSPVALKRILDVHASGGSLAEAEDFLYMRTIFANNDPEEDLFIYLSDAHIRSLTGPRWKIGEARRLRCAANLGLIGNAALWYQVDRGDLPTWPLLQAGGYLGQQQPACPDHGSYGLDDQGRAVCSVHNRIGRLSPVREIPLTHVTQRETKEYNDFVRDYNRYWRTFFDPIGIRISMGDTVRIRTCILPLIENSWYDGIAALSGRKPGTLTDTHILPRTVISLKGDIDRDLFANSGLIRELRENPFIDTSWLGHEFALNLCDGQPLFTPGGPGLGALLNGGSRGPSLGSLSIGYIASALNLPTYLTLKVNDTDKARQELPHLLQQLLMRHGDISREFSVESYTLQSDNPQPIYTVTADLSFVKIRLYLAVVGDRLVIASQRDILDELFEDHDDNDNAPTVAGNYNLTLYRQAFKQLNEVVNLDHQEQVRHACTSNLPATGLLLRGLDQPESTVAALIEKLRGYEPVCPSGGQYRLDPLKERTVCTVHGPLYDQRQPSADDRSSTTLQLVNDLKRINARLTFTPEGLMTTVEIVR